MHFPTLMAECDPPADLAALVDDLIARKAVTRELGETLLPPAVEQFIDFGIRHRDSGAGETHDLPANAKAAAESLFRNWVRA